MFLGKNRIRTEGAIQRFDLNSGRVKAIRFVIMVMCVIVSTIAVFPVMWIFLSGFKELKEFATTTSILPNHWHFIGFAQTWEKLQFWIYYKNSFIMVAGAVVSAVMFNGVLAYVLAIIKPKGDRIVYGLVMWSLLIPATTGIVALFVNINRVGWNRSYVPLWLCYGANAFYVILFKEFFEGLPKELIDAARMDGCNVLQIFYKIVLPLSKPILAVIIIFSVTAAWSDFLLPYLVLNGSGKETVMVKLYTYAVEGTTPIDRIRAIFFSMIPPMLIFMIFQRKITGTVMRGAIKG